MLFWTLQVSLVLALFPSSSQVGIGGIFLIADPQLNLQRIMPKTWPDVTTWRRFYMSHMPEVSVQLLADLSPSNARVFAVVANAAAHFKAKAMAVHRGHELTPILQEVQARSLVCGHMYALWGFALVLTVQRHAVQVEQRVHTATGTLAKEYAAGGMVNVAADEMVMMLLLQSQARTEIGRDVILYHVLN